MDPGMQMHPYDTWLASTVASLLQKMLNATIAGQELSAEQHLDASQGITHTGVLYLAYPESS